MISRLKNIYQRLIRRLFTKACPVCGFYCGSTHRDILWDELISEWKLTPDWVLWFNRREGTWCQGCRASLRYQSLAIIILRICRNHYRIYENCIRNLVQNQAFQSLDIAEINTTESLHPYLKNLEKVVYSEYGSKNPSVRSEDLLQLSYQDNHFDLVITSETLEHVPDIEKALKEIYRVLKPGGYHLFTVPIILKRKRTKQRAHIEQGKIMYDFPPSYHGDPNNNKEDFLVYYEFGSDFLTLCETCGFETFVYKDRSNPALVAFASKKPAIKLNSGD